MGSTSFRGSNPFLFALQASSQSVTLTQAYKLAVVAGPSQTARLRDLVMYQRPSVQRADYAPEDNSGKEKGRLFSNPKIEARDNRIHYTRWDAVRELMDRDDLADLASNDEERYAAVSALLEGTEAAGSEDAVRYSYRKVEGLFKQGKGGLFYQVG